MSRKKIFGALFVVAVLVLAVLSSTVRSKVSLADERKYEELPQQENIYLSANKEQPQDAIEYQPMDSISCRRAGAIAIGTAGFFTGGDRNLQNCPAGFL
ncbi:MAG: hypothetical protein ACLSB9_21415 [Hydrogeniiclostridium mannosilyticum]